MFNILASIFFYDLWFYYSHTLLHKRALYPYHKIHHKNKNPRFLDTYLGHSLEGPFQSLGSLLPFFFMSYTFLDILVILSFLNVRGMMRHDDRMVFLIGNHHLLHHLHPNYNFGEYWIDSLFHTLYPIKEERIAGLIYI